jgi:ABC-type Zn uptake system ZnuABC Zn-binding protein ZnuA
VVRIGLDYDLWLNKLLREAHPGCAAAASAMSMPSVGVPLLEIRGVSFDAAPGHSHGAGNPHYWLDPANAEPITGAILEGLMRIDPAHGATYQTNRDAFLARLKAPDLGLAPRAREARRARRS